MRALVLGAGGMLGSAILRAFPGLSGTTNGPLSTSDRVMPDVDVTDLDAVRRSIEWAHADAVVNCVGVVKSECEAAGHDRVRAVNAEFPHELAALTAARGIRVVHVSTDCVFDGSRGNRTESDAPDATDLYGRSKAAGEILDRDHCVTLRTSFVGRDRLRARGLVEWLLAQPPGEVTGYERAMWSGLSADELARVVGSVVLPNAGLRGLHHVSGPAITKADLLRLLVRAYGVPLTVKGLTEPVLDRSLDGSAFRDATGYTPPTWHEMAEEMARDGT